ncbi:hypothetical protein Thermo_01856 [Thermoplasmatales archaeon]|nr:hypothetical protein Thermo_01856 [Thermoplasmatales archaeon]
MDGLSQESVSYLKEKIAQWTEGGESLRKHASILGGRNKLKIEFHEDVATKLPSVCRDINRLGYEKSRKEILNLVKGKKGTFKLFPSFGTADVILGGLSDACGFRRKGDKIEWW